MASEDFTLSDIGQIALTVENVDRATGFYRDVLGMRHLFSAGTMSFFDCGGVRLMLGMAEGEGATHSSILYFRVDDIEAAHRTLHGRGVEFVHEPRLVHPAEDHDLWMGFFKDTEGNVLALMSEVPRS